MKPQQTLMNQLYLSPWRTLERGKLLNMNHSIEWSFYHIKMHTWLGLNNTKTNSFPHPFFLYHLQEQSDWWYS